MNTFSTKNTIKALTLLELPDDRAITTEMIKTNFRKLCLIYHPDQANARYKDGEKFCQLKEAQEYLVENLSAVNEQICGGFQESSCSYEADQRRKAEEARRAEAARKTEEARRAQQAEEARRRAEAARRTEEGKSDRKAKRIAAISIILVIGLAVLLACIPKNNNSDINKISTSENRNSKSIIEVEPVKNTIMPYYSEYSKKSNLDWKAVDTDPNDNILVFYGLKLNDSETHYRYTFKVDFDNNRLNVEISYYENEWSKYEGGRITGIHTPGSDIIWEDSEKKLGTFSKGEAIYKIEIKDNSLLVSVESGKDKSKIVGEYTKAN